MIIRDALNRLVFRVEHIHHRSAYLAEVAVLCGLTPRSISVTENALVFMQDEEGQIHDQKEGNPNGKPSVG